MANNLGKYLHPAKPRESEGSPAETRRDAAGMKKTGMTAKAWEASAEDAKQDAATPPTRRPRVRVLPPGGQPMDAAGEAAPAASLTAEERFYRSAKPAPVKGYR